MPYIYRKILYKFQLVREEYLTHCISTWYKSMVFENTLDKWLKSLYPKDKYFEQKGK